MTLDEFTHAALWEQALCLECEETFDPREERVCPACSSYAVFLARDIERVEAWLASLERD